MNAPSRFSLFFACFGLVAAPMSAAAAGDPVNGKALYDATCVSSSCHRSPPNNNILWVAGNVSKLQFAIVNGFMAMLDIPSVLALTDSQLTDIVTYLATFVTPASTNYQGIWWNANESGWGINFAHQGDQIFASWFTYDTTGRGWWLVMTALKTATNTYSGKLYQTRGPAFNAVPFDPSTVVPTEVGTGTLTFTDANNGTFAYVVGTISQTKPITRQVFGILPTCTFGTQPNLALATNYQDLWWAKPATSESGWGINLNHESDTIFATWFTYDFDHTPLWLVVTAQKTGPGVYTGDLYRTSGARFDAFDRSKVVSVKVGTATFTVADGNNATFSYTVQVAGIANPVTQTKAITRELFSTLGTTCQ